MPRMNPVKSIQLTGGADSENTRIPYLDDAQREAKRLEARGTREYTTLMAMGTPRFRTQDFYFHCYVCGLDTPREKTAKKHEKTTGHVIRRVGWDQHHTALWGHLTGNEPIEYEQGG